MSVVQMILSSAVFLAVVAFYIWMIAVGFFAMVRILNRTGFSGWWLLIGFIPIVGIIALSRFSKARWRVAPEDISPHLSTR